MNDRSLRGACRTCCSNEHPEKRSGDRSDDQPPLPPARAVAFAGAVGVGVASSRQVGTVHHRLGKVRRAMRTVVQRFYLLPGPAPYGQQAAPVLCSGCRARCARHHLQCNERSALQKPTPKKRSAFFEQTTNRHYAPWCINARARTSLPKPRSTVQPASGTYRQPAPRVPHEQSFPCSAPPVFGGR